VGATTAGETAFSSRPRIALGLGTNRGDYGASRAGTLIVGLAIASGVVAPFATGAGALPFYSSLLSQEHTSCVPETSLTYCDAYCQTNARSVFTSWRRSQNRVPHMRTNQ
jgi:hypothetical protein